MRVYRLTRGWVLLGLSALTILLAFHPSAAGALEQYQYFDDFSTGKARQDSYRNSGISDPPCPDLSFYGSLCYLPDSLGDRCLAFSCGFEMECAHLCYRFPVGSAGLDITDAMIGFEVPEMTDPWGSIDVYRSYDGTFWTLLEAIAAPGTYEYHFAPPQPCEWLYIKFSGGGIMIDDLSVTLNYNTATDASTWGMIKALFR
ncbi:MAG: hypothetical protein V1694_06485 [Candidatus Eisenbacteria bacterium]